MVFTSSVFLFLFLPLFLAVYYLTPPARRSSVMLIASYLFYGWWRLDFLALFIGSTLFTYLIGRKLARSWPERRPLARRLLTLGVAGNLATLGYFKYFNFGVESLDTLLLALGGAPLGAWQVLLPIGISFYVFQGVSYLIDSYRGDAGGTHRFVDVAAFIALFPQLIAGPIVRYKDLSPQLTQPQVSYSDFGIGARRFMIGFCKKVLIADMVAPLADGVFALASPTLAEAWLGALAFAIQLFFDFSGYSDMAIGLARMMGLRLLENFAMPYRSATITEFWRRWHISLSRWLRDYLYIPLGGNRRRRRRTYINLALVMLLGGLWHGAAWTFVLWGAWHGALLVGERLLRESRVSLAMPRAVAVVRTFLLVTVGWVTFRAGGFGAAVAMYRGMVGANGILLSATLQWQLPATALFALAIGCLIAWLAPWRAPEDRARPAHTRAARQPAVARHALSRHAESWQGLPARVPRMPLPPRLPRLPRQAAASLTTPLLLSVFLLGVLRTVASSFSPFLYFQF